MKYKIQINKESKTCTLLKIEEEFIGNGIIKLPTCFFVGNKKYIITKLGNNLFENTKITGVVFPNSITEIGDECFKNCNMIISLIIPSTIKVVGEGIFRDCKNLKIVRILSTETRLNNSFSGCPITTLVKFK